MKRLANTLLAILAAGVGAMNAQTPAPTSGTSGDTAAGPSASPSPSATPSKDEYVIYSTEVGWLRVGTRDEYESKMAKKDEINGGTSADPLEKTLLAPGFDNRDGAVKYLCDHLTKVQLRIAPPAFGGPARYLTAVLRGKEYNLRLTKGFDAEMTAAMSSTGKAYKALEYDWESEWGTLAKYNITPRYVFPRREWLIHETGHGSVNGPVKEDRWMCSSTMPELNERHEKVVVLADGMGGTITYGLKEVEGPFMDNYTMAKVMKKYHVDKVDLWPPVTSAVGRDVQPRVEANKIPNKPRDFGDASLPTQPLSPNKALEDWVIYSVEDKWLHCGTRYEFNLPLFKKDVIWAGTTQDPAKKTILAPDKSAKEPFRSRKAALRVLIGDLVDIDTSFNPSAQPYETVIAKYRGQDFNLRIERGENGDFEVEGPGGLNYDFGGNVASLREIDKNITPKKTFKPMWVVHATAHGTMDGTRKDDIWMPLGGAPATGNTFIIPDGMGGTFGYSYDKGGGPFTDSYALINYLRQIKDPKVTGIGIYAENRGVSLSDIPDGIKPVNNGTPIAPPAIILKSVIPDSARQGDTVGLLILGSNIETGCRGALGPKIKVKDMAYFGRDADTQLEQWVATAEIEKDAPVGKRTLSVYNQLTSYGTLPNAFEVKECLSDFCAPMEYVVPAGAKDWIAKQTSEDALIGVTDPTEKDRLLKQIRDRRTRLQANVQKIADLKEQHQLKWSDLEKLVGDLGDAESKKQFNDEVRLLQKRADLEKEIRGIDTEYFKAISPVIESFTDKELTQLIATLRVRAECLTKHAAAALDDARKYNYTVSWEQFAQKKLLYDIHQENLVHALNGFQTVNSMRLLDAQRRISKERARVMQGGGDAAALAKDSKTLQPLQRRLRNVYIDMGLVALTLTEAQAEASMLDQESYLAGIYGVTKQSKNIELAKTLKEQSGQAMIFSLKYILTGGTSLLGTGIDSVKRFFNFVAEKSADSSVFDTVSSEVSKQIKESREKAQLGVNTLKRIQVYDDQKSRELPTLADEGAKSLVSNRIFNEQTSGGLRRMSACYITDIPQLLDEELLIAKEHAALVAADMDKAFNAKVGADAKGDIPFKKMLTDPIGTIKVAIQDTAWGGDHFSPTIEYIARRKGQLQEMDVVRQALGTVRFEPFGLQQKLPKIYAFYLELEEDNPDFLQWTLVRERLAAQQRLDAIDRSLAKNFGPAIRLQLQQMQARNRSQVLNEAADKQAHICQLQGADKMMVWDYDGALECFYQAADWNPKIQPLGKVESLRADLAWQKTVEAGMEVAAQVGNMGVQTAMFEFLGQSIGRILNVKGAPAAATTGAAEDTAAEASVWTRPIPGGGFADFVWKQFNPFADFIKAGVVEREWGAMGKAAAGVAVNVNTQIVQQDVLKKGVLIGYLGADDQWADFLANALVTTSQVKLGSGNSVLTEVASWLTDAYRRFDFKVVDISLWNERQQARTSVSDFYTFLTWLKEMKDAREKVSGKKLLNEAESEIRTATEPIVEAQQKVEKTLTPVEKETLQDLYDDLFPKIGPTMDPVQRLAQIRKFFTGLNWKQNIMTLKLPKTDELNIKIDNLRRELLSMAQVDFFQQDAYKKYSDYVVDYLYIGSAGNKESAAYKKTDSDIDFTLLVKEETPEAVRNQIRDDFMKFFIDYSGKEIEGYEMSIMVDNMPKFFKTGESAQGIVDAIYGETNMQKRAQNRTELKAGIEKTIEQLIQNASDKERYLDRGNLFRHNLFVRLGCFLKKAAIQRTADGAELIDEPASKYDELYGDVPLEPWMAFDAVIGNLGYIFEHSLQDAKDDVSYQKILSGKYAVRGALYSMLLMSPVGRERLRTLSRAEVEQRGWEGAERIVVEVAKEVLGKPNGMKELGLPNTIDVPGKGLLRMSPTDWAYLFEEWNYRKEGLPLEQVFGKPRDQKFDADHPMVPRLLAENVIKTEAVFKAAIRKTIVEQGTELMLLRNARKDCLKMNDQETAGILELKMKEILFSQAAVWNRMSREQQNLVLKECPPEADWWYAIADVEGLREASASPAPTKEMPERVVLNANQMRAWQPKVFRDDNPDEIVRRIAALKQRAKDAPATVVCNVGPTLTPK